MRKNIVRWLMTPHDRALETEVEGLTIRLQQAEAQLKALYQALDEWHNSGGGRRGKMNLENYPDYLALPPRRDWP